MHKIIALAVCGIIGLSAHAQERTYSVSKRNFSSLKGSVLLVPYEHKMLLSDINREVGNRTGMELDEIRMLFREGLCQVASNELSSDFSLIDLINSGEDGSLDDIERAHHSIGYTYDLIPPPLDQQPSKARKLFDSVVNKESEDQIGRGAYLEQGEVFTYYDEKDRYMNTQILTEDVFDYLGKRHSFDFVLFINELDIQVQRIHSSERGQIWDRVVKIHYTLFDKEGNQILGGAAYNRYDGSEKDIFRIIGTNFQPAIADLKLQILAALDEDAESDAKKTLPFTFRKEKKETSEATDTGFHP